MLATTNGDAAVFFDSLTDCWRGDENDNAAIALFDQTVQKPLQAQGATPFVVHHTGHPQQFVKRTGVSAGRGASSLGQKADTILVFKAGSDREFTIHHAKARIGGRREPDRTYRVVDTEEGVDILEQAAHPELDAELAKERALAVLREEPGKHTKTALAERLGLRLAEGLVVVGDLLRDGTVGPDKPRARLRVLGEASEASQEVLVG